MAIPAPDRENADSVAGTSQASADANSYALGNEGYEAEKYWTDRHNRYRHSFCGVGNLSLSEEANVQDYVAAVDTMRDLLRLVSLDPRGKSALDIGCGNGFWTGILQEWGVKAYVGLDITDALFDLLQKRHPQFEFVAGKVQALPLRSGYELITMIDVTQHITDDFELQDILTRVRSLLAENGVFIVTFWNKVQPQEVFYETFRPFRFYTATLAGMAHTPPIRFRDKFVAAFYNPDRRGNDVPPRALPRESIIGIVEKILAP